MPIARPKIDVGLFRAAAILPRVVSAKAPHAVFVEAALANQIGRIAGQLPLAGHGRRIAGPLQHRAKREVMGNVLAQILSIGRTARLCLHKQARRLQTKRQVLNELLARELLGDRKRAASRLISPHGLVGRGEYREYGATAGRAGKCESHRTTDTPQARETT